MDNSLEKWLKAKQPVDVGISACKIGDVISDWKILALLGKGGSAEVYRVEHVESKKIGALKLLCRQEETLRKRFIQECDLLRKQKISCFAEFFEAGECEGRLFLVTEELQFFELPHKDPEVTKFLLDVCKAVSVLHSEGYVHRDLKPGNIMRRADGSYVLIDLGLVKKVAKVDDIGFRGETLSVVDGHREGVGTPGYSAPEQFVSGKATEASDVHAIAMLVNACFEGNPPSNWSRLIVRATSSIDSRRYQSIDELVCAIKSASAVRPGVAIFAEVLSVIEVGLWAFCLLALAIGMIFGEISYETTQRNILVLLLLMGIIGWLSIIELGLRRRKNWARLYVVVIGIVDLLVMFGVGLSAEIGRSFWLAAIIFGISRIIPGALFLVPNVRRWFRASA